MFIRNPIVTIVWLSVLCCPFATNTVAFNSQSKPTPAEIAEWKQSKEPMESSKCRKIAWLLESESLTGRSFVNQPIRYGLGWWGRGFVEGALAFSDNEKAKQQAAEFGLSVEVVASHVSTYCVAHPDETPMEAMHTLLLKVVK